MKPSLGTAAALLPFLPLLTAAQLLTNGNSRLPACGTTCALLTQAAQACGGTSTANQQIWSCFCQSGYLKSLYTSPTSICDASCTNPSDNQQVMTWFTSNCGTDDGASEHADSGGATTAVITSTSAAATVAASTAAALPSTTASGGTVEPDAHTSSGSTWWNTHYKWVIMLIVLFVALLLLALLAIFLKRHHDRKADQIREGFNTGITTRSTPMTTVAGTDGVNDSNYMSNAQTVSGGLESGSGRNSPARTREAFMPYGYSYTRSESRLGSRADDIGGRKSPLAPGGTPVGELEKDAGMSAGPLNSAPPPKKTRRVLVRERSMESPSSPEIEKGMR